MLALKRCEIPRTTLDGTPIPRANGPGSRSNHEPSAGVKCLQCKEVLRPDLASGRDIMSQKRLEQAGPAHARRGDGEESRLDDFEQDPRGTRASRARPRSPIPDQRSGTTPGTRRHRAGRPTPPSPAASNQPAPTRLDRSISDEPCQGIQRQERVKKRQQLLVIQLVQPRCAESDECRSHHRGGHAKAEPLPKQQQAGRIVERRHHHHPQAERQVRRCSQNSTQPVHRADGSAARPNTLRSCGAG